MHCKKLIITAAAAGVSASLLAGLYGDTPDAKHAWAVHDMNRPLASRWDNKTCSVLSADENEVMKLRRETAAKLYAKIADPKAPTAATVKALAEVIAYANENPYKAAFDAALAAYRAKPGDAKEVADVNRTLDVLVCNHVIDEKAKISQ